MTKLTAEETNLLSIYKTGSRQGLIIAMNVALPFMDGEILPRLPEAYHPQTSRRAHEEKMHPGSFGFKIILV